MALTKIKGQNFRVFAAGDVVTEATSCSVTISGNMEESSTKDSVNSWKEEQMTSKSWQVQVDNIEATVTALRNIISRFNSDEPTIIGFDQTNGATNKNAANANFARSGKAILNDLSIQADDRATINITCQYQGTGPLA